MIPHNITRTDDWFTGEVKSLDYEVLMSDDATPLNCAALTFSWFLKVNESDLDADALLTKSGASITVVGVYNVDRSVNTQRVRVAIAAADTRSITGWTKDSNLRYWHELKRTDTETVISKGTVILQQSLHRTAP